MNLAHLRAWRALGMRSLLLAMVLSGLLAALLAARSHAGSRPPDPRRKLIDGASVLLQGLPTQSFIHDDTLRVAAMLEPLRSFARENARSLTHQAALETAAEKEAPPALAQTPDTVPVTTMNAPRIPDAIEGGGTSSFASDALSTVTVSSYLRTLDGSEAPFTLESIRTRPGPARVRIHIRSAASQAPAQAAWYETGEAPLPGWRIVRIAGDSLLVLTPLGNPMRLKLAADVH